MAANPDKPSPAILPRYFEQDADGRTVFRPFGPGYRGYVVRDAATEAELRRTMAAHVSWAGAVGTLAAIPGIVVFFAIVGAYPWRAIAALFLLPAALWALLVAWSTVRLRRTVVRLGLVDAVPGCRTAVPWTVLLSLSLVAVLTWAAVAEYGHRAGAAVGGDVLFYPDISLPLLVTLFFGGGLVLFVFRPRNTPARMVPKPHVIVASGVFALFGLGWTATLLLAPTPSIVVAPDALTCGNWYVGWQEIAGIHLDRGSRGKERAVLVLEPAVLADGRWTDFIRQRGAVNCTVTGKNADYRTVYDAIYSAWRRARFPTVDTDERADMTGDAMPASAGIGTDPLPEPGTRGARLL